jgi:hypothetical protein
LRASRHPSFPREQGLQITFRLKIYPHDYLKSQNTYDSTHAQLASKLRVQRSFRRRRSLRTQGDVAGVEYRLRCTCG